MNDLLTRSGALRHAALGVVAASLVATNALGTGREIDPGSPVRTRCGELMVDLGERRTLLPHGALGLTYFPDQGVSTLRSSPQLRLLLVAKFSTYLVEGPSIQALERATEVLRPGRPGDFDNGYAGVGGGYTHGDGRLYVFYHAEDWQGLPTSPIGIHGFYASVGVAVSSDSGATWKKLGAGITSSKPKSWQAFDRHHGRGAGFPTAVTDDDGENLLLYYNDLSHMDGRGVQIFLARAALADGRPVPGRFWKYYEGGFSEPGLGGLDSPVLSALGLDQSAAVQPFVIRSDSLRRYLLFFNIQSWKEHPDFHKPAKPAGRVSGLYLATSRDGISWSEPCKLFSDRAFPEMGRSISWEAGMVADADDDSAGWLVYGYTPSWGPGTRLAPGPPHFMVGRRIEVSRIED
jgi:hypothetical protein